MLLSRSLHRALTRSRPLRLALLLCVAAFLLEILYLRRIFLSSLNSSLLPRVSGAQQRVYIASTHWNNEVVLRSHWNGAVLDLVREIGIDNAYVSVHESGSWDDSKSALRELDLALGELEVSRNFVLDYTTHIDEIEKPPAASGWIDTPRERKELRRIPYLSKLRNASLRPLYDLEAQGLVFDKILFLNDVVFDTEDFLRLLNTNDGSYAAACALDFAKPPRYYDTFALRDSEGEEALMQTWPYFRSQTSRQAMLRNQAVPLTSCWNGMVIMDAAPFYDDGSATRLAFRGVDDSLAKAHVEGSECCLIHADNPLTLDKGVWLNPDVRVGYSGSAYDAVHRSDVWLGIGRFTIGIWGNRLRRLLTTTWFKNTMVRSRLQAWERENPNRHEPGAHCLINEMQVLASNGWAHV